MSNYSTWKCYVSIYGSDSADRPCGEAVWEPESEMWYVAFYRVDDLKLFLVKHEMMVFEHDMDDDAFYIQLQRRGMQYE